MRIIAFITEPRTVRQILAHRGEPTRLPRCAPARGSPLWEAAQPLPEIAFDQRLAW
jgi:hypothetical protein